MDVQIKDPVAYMGKALDVYISGLDPFAQDAAGTLLKMAADQCRKEVADAKQEIAQCKMTEGVLMNTNEGLTGKVASLEKTLDDFRAVVNGFDSGLTVGDVRAIFTNKGLL